MRWAAKNCGIMGTSSLLICGWCGALSSTGTAVNPARRNCGSQVVLRPIGTTGSHLNAKPLDAHCSKLLGLRGGWHTHPAPAGGLGSGRSVEFFAAATDQPLRRGRRFHPQCQRKHGVTEAEVGYPIRAFQTICSAGGRSSRIPLPRVEIRHDRDREAGGRCSGPAGIFCAAISAHEDGGESPPSVGAAGAAAGGEHRGLESVLAGGGGGSEDGGGDGGGEGDESVDGRTAAFTALASASILVSYADRGNFASVIVPMGEQFDWSPTFEGLVMSAFFVGYAATQTLGGWLADRYGGRQTLMAGLAAWSLFTLVTPLAAAWGTTSLLATRIALGLGEGFAFPSVHAMIAEEVPKHQRSTVVGCVTAASYAGALVAFWASPAIMLSTGGWEAVFYTFGGFSLLLLPAWLLLPPGTAKVGATSSSDRSFAESAVDRGGARGPPLEAQARELASVAARLGKRKEVWAIIGAQFCQSVTMYGLLSWLPTYLHDAKGLAADSPELGTLAAAPYAIQALVGAGAGLAADRLISKERWRVKTVRQAMQTAGMLGSAFCICAAVFEPRVDISVAWTVVGSGVSAFTLGGVSVNHLDISPKHAGLVFGAGNTAATIAGLLTVPLCGWLLETFESWDRVFFLFAASSAVGALLFFSWVGDEEIE